MLYLILLLLPASSFTTLSLKITLNSLTAPSLVYCICPHLKLFPVDGELCSISKMGCLVIATVIALLMGIVESCISLRHERVLLIFKENMTFNKQ